MAIAASAGRGRATLRVPVAAAAAAVVLAELLVGAAIASGQQQMAVVAVLGIAGAYAVARAPFAASVAFLALAASVLVGDAHRIPFAGRMILPHEPVLVALVAVAALRPRRKSWGGGIGLALALFLGTLALTSVVAVATGDVDLNTVLLWGRGYAALAFFWVVIRLFPSREEVMRLLAAAAVIGGITGIVSLVFALGVSPGILIPNPGENVISDAGGSLLRVRLPGVALAFTLLPLALYLLANGRRPRLLWGAALAGCLLAVLISLNRNMWVALLLGASLLLTVTGPRTRTRVLSSLATLGAALALLLAVPTTSTPISDALAPLVARGSTLLDPSHVRDEASVQDRSRETRIAWAAARDAPLLGIAPGVPWGSYITDTTTEPPRRVPQLFLHNQYLYLLVITGVPGLLCIAAFLLGSARAGLSDPRRTPLLATLGVAIVMVMLTAAVMLSLSDTSYLAATALVAGAIVALRTEVEAR